MNGVPTAAAVIRGASVNIILKADQPTGRTVSGKVQDILTRGSRNHPRGLKVRLTDGRVGRVQSMAGQGQPNISQGVSTESGPIEGAAESSRSGDRGGRRHRGGREAAEGDLPAQTIGLDAYIKPAKVKKGAAQAQDRRSPDESAELVKCPVCGEFEGDATAVEHHVALHFD